MNVTLHSRNESRREVQFFKDPANDSGLCWILITEKESELTIFFKNIKGAKDFVETLSSALTPRETEPDVSDSAS